MKSRSVEPSRDVVQPGDSRTAPLDSPTVLVQDIPLDARLVAFDLDDTLAPSKSELDPRMGGAVPSTKGVL